MGYNSKKIFNIVKKKIEKNTRLVLQKSKNKNISTRKAANEIAIERIKKHK